MPRERSRRRRVRSMHLEPLEGRQLLSSLGSWDARSALLARRDAWVERQRNLTPLPVPGARPYLDRGTVGSQVGNSGSQTIPAAEADKGKPFTLKRPRSTIYGLLLPAPLLTEGKNRGAGIVSGGVVWVLDLTAVKGYDSYAQNLIGKAVAVFGTAEIEQAADGTEKRKIKVTWMEPLQNTQDLPPAFPALQPILHPNIPNPPTPRG